MRIADLACPACGARNVVDQGVVDIGTVRLRCHRCTHYFPPPESPRTRTVEDVVNAAVPITVWEP